MALTSDRLVCPSRGFFLACFAAASGLMALLVEADGTRKLVANLGRYLMRSHFDEVDHCNHSAQ